MYPEPPAPAPALTPAPASDHTREDGRTTVTFVGRKHYNQRTIGRGLPLFHFSAVSDTNYTLHTPWYPTTPAKHPINNP